MEHKIGAQLQRPLIDGSGKSVVGHDRRSRPVARFRQARDVDYLERGIGGRFQIDDFATLRDLGLNLLEVRGVAKLDDQIHLWKKFSKQLVRPAVRVLDGYDPVAGPEQSKKGIADGGHPGSHAGGGFGCFQDPNFLFERSDCRVGIPAVNVARLPAESGILPGFEVVVTERHTLHNGDLGRPLRQGFFFSGPYHLSADSGIKDTPAHAELLC